MPDHHDATHSEICELCGRDTLEAAYSPERSTRGLTVQLCKHCGLVQSTPRIDRAPRAAMAVSSGADWGNVRYGKGFRTRPALTALKRHAETSKPLAILDVGSNRGSFVKAVLDDVPDATITALEPDERVAASCANLPRVDSSPRASRMRRWRASVSTSSIPVTRSSTSPIRRPRSPITGAC